MSADPETVMEGLKAFLESTVGSSFPTISRRAKHWSLVTEQPALMARCIGQDDVFQGEGMPITTLDVELWIFAKTDDGDLAPETKLNELVAAVRTALAPQDVEEFQTLNGLVHHARIEGRSNYDPGDLDGQSKATLSLKIMLPSYP